VTIPTQWLAVLVLSMAMQPAVPTAEELHTEAVGSVSVAAIRNVGASEAEEDLLPNVAAAESAVAQQRGQQAPTLKQGALLGAAAGCTFVGVLMARAAPEDTRTAAFITGCALGAPLGAIAGFFAALGSR
jgi:hypothetical protein